MESKIITTRVKIAELRSLELFSPFQENTLQSRGYFSHHEPCWWGLVHGCLGCTQPTWHAGRLFTKNLLGHYIHLSSIHICCNLEKNSCCCGKSAGSKQTGAWAVKPGRTTSLLPQTHTCSEWGRRRQLPHPVTSCRFGSSSSCRRAAFFHHRHCRKVLDSCVLLILTTSKSGKRHSSAYWCHGDDELSRKQMRTAG